METPNDMKKKCNLHLFKRLTGRKTIRRREESESGPRRRSSAGRCAVRMQFGHSRRGCQRAPINDKRSKKIKMRDEADGVASGAGRGGAGKVDAASSARRGWSFSGGTRAARSWGQTGRGAVTRGMLQVLELLQKGCYTHNHSRLSLYPLIIPISLVTLSVEPSISHFASPTCNSIIADYFI
ncbi:hypothetical protein CFOL_v3_29594 [Cephalotus follicularis]|uniref:Uncharacterized protein n=1 Tax=Cephalotus follicularis TaxID=3775 RepID=A0A1Q3D174_CEPFO|nr:hypothetical protein CFOL_v3_29594 [Cephalotus follicularis]